MSRSPSVQPRLHLANEVVYIALTGNMWYYYFSFKARESYAKRTRKHSAL